MSTESINEDSKNLDLLDSKAFVALFLKEENKTKIALELAQDDISTAIDLISKKFIENGYHEKSLEEVYKGPRLFYIGAGTSGRLGVLDASECPPTFSVDRSMIQGIIAGGDMAIKEAVEGAEDDERAGYQIIIEKLQEQDSLVALSANGSAGYVIGALKAAQEKKALTISIANNPNAEIFNYSFHKILLETGPELLSGSTRLKAGTAQKICLNILSTGLMTKLGKVYSNLMVDLKASNKKLKKRSCKLVSMVTGIDEDKAEIILKENDYDTKTVILMIKLNISYKEALSKLKSSQGSLRRCLL